MNQERFPERDLQIFEMVGIGIPNQVVRQQQRVPNVPNFNQAVIQRHIGFPMPNHVVRQQQRVHQEPMDIDDDRMDIDSPKKRKSPKRKVVKRKSPKRKSPKRKVVKRKSPKRKVVKKKSPKRKSPKRKSPKRRTRK